MNSLQTRTLPRLMLDTVHCLLVAHDYIDHALQSKTRNTVVSLSNTDMTDIERAASTLRNATLHLWEVEASLKARNRSLTARKIRNVREQVLFATAA
jgi:hypothetical protein